MAEPYYKIDHAVCDPLDLWDREAMVYSALLYLCKLKPYKGSANELRLFCQIKSKSTILRILSLLIEKGLISRTPDGIIVNQYGSQVVHNGAVSNHSGAISKEKRTKKENIIKENKESESYTTSPAPAKMIKKEDFIPPTWSEWWTFAKEKQMGEFEAQKSFSYYSMRGWKDISNWKAALVYWDLKNKT